MRIAMLCRAINFLQNLILQMRELYAKFLLAKVSAAAHFVKANFLRILSALPYLGARICCNQNMCKNCDISELNLFFVNYGNLFETMQDCRRWKYLCDNVTLQEKIYFCDNVRLQEKEKNISRWMLHSGVISGWVVGSPSGVS